MISVIMSVFNEKIEWINESIGSILNQSYSDIELIVVVDNPQLEKAKKECLESWAAKDHRMKVMYNEVNLGVAYSMNIALGEANGEYIAKMDADDVSMPERLERELAYLIDNKIDVVATNAIFIDENGEETGRGAYIPENQNEELMYTNRIFHPSALATAAAYRQVGGYRNFRRSQDYDLWLRMLSSGKKIRVMNEYLIKYRKSCTQASYAHRLEQYYVNKYQKKLYNERLRKGKDSFSDEHLKAYLASKKITEEKNMRCIAVMDIMRQSKQNKTVSQKMVLYAKAFFLFPSIVIDFVCRKMRRVLR